MPNSNQIPNASDVTAKTKRTLRVLMVEDSTDDALIEQHELRRAGYEVVATRVESAEDFEREITTHKWDLVISDHMLPNFSSLQALDIFRHLDEDVPFIIVSGTIGEEVAVAARKAGANDYVMKNQLGRLVPSVERELRDAWGRQARRRAEEALRNNELELNDFFEHAPVGFHWMGPDGIIQRANRAELEMLGYAHVEYAGHPLSEFYVDSSVAADVLRRLHAGESLTDYEAHLRCKDGSVKTVLINCNVLWDEGQFVHSRCFTRDITESREGEKALAFLAAIVHSSDDAIIGTSTEGIIQTWNTGAEQLYGYAAADMINQPITNIAPNFLPEEWQQLTARMTAGENLDRHETTRIRKNGSTVEVAAMLSAIKDRHGKIIGISSIERDITARKKEEEERLKLITELTEALARIKTLRGLLPICASCKKIRDDHGYWKKIESYISEHTQAEFTHGICPDCMLKLYPEYTVKR